MKDKKELPFVSIVVIAYNEEKSIEFTLKSLLNQNYPKNKYEIIVVDDCSKDKTVEIAKEFPIKLIKHKKNLGRSQARNTGLKYAKGEIYVSFDGDCIAEKSWLKELTKLYANKTEVLGSGGKIILPNRGNLIDKFILEDGCGNPSPIYATEAKSLFARFKSYLTSKFSDLNNNHFYIIKVGNIMGANASFYTSDLKSVKGWDINLKSEEDTDICYRLKSKFPNKSFYWNKNAKIVHNPNMSFSDYLKRPFFRGKDVVKLYKKQNKSLPIFPFPLLIIFFSLLSLFIGIIPFILFLLILPQIFYFWNIIKFFNKFDFSFLIFSYMKFLLEFVFILGLIRGYIILNKDSK